MMSVPLTAIILTHNEAVNIGPCLKTLDWIDDVIVVDSGSTDATIAEAQAARPDVRIFEHPFLDFGDQRNWALDETAPKHPWILFLDADERSTPVFVAGVTKVLMNPGATVGYFCCYRNFFLGRWIKRSTDYPTWQLRILKLGQVRYQKMGHGQMEVTDGPLEYLHAPYDHFGFSKGIANWVDRHNKYSTEESGYILDQRQEPLGISDLFRRDPVQRRRFLKRLGAKLPFRPLTRFCYTYFLKLGFLDGKAGLMYSLLRLSHDLHIVVKLAERKANPSHERRSAE